MRGRDRPQTDSVDIGNNAVWLPLTAHFKLHEASFIGYVAACTVVTFALAGLSWHLVEKQALKWK